MPVEGVGGLFMRARDPDALGAWYAEHLGVGPGFGPDGTRAEDDWFWRTAGGPVVFAPFPLDSDYFPTDRQWMLNLRVSGIDTLLDRLRASGVAVETRAEWDSPETGRFARIHDLEGNPIELWEPAA